VKNPFRTKHRSEDRENNPHGRRQPRAGSRAVVVEFEQSEALGGRCRYPSLRHGRGTWLNFAARKRAVNEHDPPPRYALHWKPLGASLLVRAGVLVAEDEQPYLDLAMDSPYEQLAGAAIRYVIAAGPQAGRATMRLHDPVLAVGESGARTKPLPPLSMDSRSTAPSPVRLMNAPNSNGCAGRPCLSGPI